MRTMACIAALLLAGNSFGQFALVGCHVGDSGLPASLCPYLLGGATNAHGFGVSARLPTTAIDGATEAFWRLLGDGVPPIEYSVPIDLNGGLLVDSRNGHYLHVGQHVNLISELVLPGDAFNEYLPVSAAPDGLVAAANNPAYNVLEIGIGTTSLRTTFNNPLWGGFDAARFSFLVYHHRPTRILTAGLSLSDVAIVPEPTTWVLAITGIMLCAPQARRITRER